MILNVTYGFRTNKALSIRWLPSSMSLSPFRRLVGITGVSLALQELLYGLIMALIFITAARVGVLHYTDRENLVILIMGMNLTWGAIDAIVFYLLDIFEQRRFVGIMNGSRNIPRERRVDMMMDSFSGTPLDILDPASEREVCERILDMEIEGPGRLAMDRRDMAMSSLGCFVITALTILPTALPVLLFEDVDTGLAVASGLSSVILMVVGYRMGPILGVNRWVLALALTGFSWAITVVATFTGG